MTRIEEIKKNCEMAIKFGSHGNAMHAVREDIPYLIERLERAETVLREIAADYVTEGDCPACDFGPGLSTKHHEGCAFQMAESYFSSCHKNYPKIMTGSEGDRGIRFAAEELRPDWADEMDEQVRRMTTGEKPK